MSIIVPGFVSSFFSGLRGSASPLQAPRRSARWRRHVAFAALCAPAMLLAGCDSSPWVDSRREAGTLRTVGDSTPDRPAICYDPDTTTASQLQSMADQVCAKTKRHARYIGMTRWQCSVATPYRAYYRCE